MHGIVGKDITSFVEFNQVGNKTCQRCYPHVDENSVSIKGSGFPGLDILENKSFYILLSPDLRQDSIPLHGYFFVLEGPFRGQGHRPQLVPAVDDVDAAGEACEKKGLFHS